MHDTFTEQYRIVGYFFLFLFKYMLAALKVSNCTPEFRMLRVMQKVVLRQLFSISINTVAIREKFRKWCTRAVQTTYICICANE